MQIPAVERWLDEGWSPWRIGYGAVALVATAVTVYGYVSHPHHPGAVWWLLGGMAVIAVWALMEADRWRIKYRRLLATRRASSSVSLPKPISKLLAEGKGLRADISSVNAAMGATRISRAMIGSLPGKIVRWEGSVNEALAKQPEILSLFQNSPKVDAARPLSYQAYSRIDHQLKVLDTIATNPRAPSDRQLNLVGEVEKELTAYYADKAKRLYGLYEQGHKLRATFGSSGNLKDQSNPDLADDINQWQSAVGDALMYWPDLYTQLCNGRKRLIFEYTSVLDASERIDRELSILHTAMTQARPHHS